jgi:SHS2 domain-containing protein
MRKTLLALSFIVSLAPLLLAHGNEKHVLGTVTKISDTEITVETKTKEAVTVKIVAETKFVKSGENATWKDLKVGDRVAIHAKLVGDILEAHEVRFGSAKAGTPGKSAKN